MQLVRLRIRNYKVIRDMEICDIENALILVGKNNTGKTSVLDAIRVVSGVEAVSYTHLKHAWYYNSMVDLLKELGDYPEYQEYVRLCRTVFGGAPGGPSSGIPQSRLWHRD